MRDAWDRVLGINDVDRPLHGDFVTCLLDQVLTKMDVSTMARSVEARSPLLDQHLIAHAASLPNALRRRHFTNGYVLKRLAERYVPGEVLLRRKRGFVMSASDGLRGGLWPFFWVALDSTLFLDRRWIRPAFVRRMLGERR